MYDEKSIIVRSNGEKLRKYQEGLTAEWTIAAFKHWLDLESKKLLPDVSRYQAVFAERFGVQLDSEVAIMFGGFLGGLDIMSWIASAEEV